MLVADFGGRSGRGVRLGPAIAWQARVSSLTRCHRRVTACADISSFSSFMLFKFFNIVQVLAAAAQAFQLD